MKTLTLLRHAKSAWDDQAIPDFDRPLNPRGKHAALAVGRELRETGEAFDDVLASPARRVVETLALLEQGYGKPLARRFDRRIYAASADLLLRIVQESDDRTNKLLLVGHNPGLEQLALALTGGDEEGHRRRLMTKFPTAAFVVIALPGASWQQAGRAGGVIERFVRPSDLGD